MQTIDLSNTIRPFALLEIANYLKRLPSGEEIEIFGLDAGAIHDLKCILPVQTHRIRIDTFGDSHSRMVVRIQKCFGER